MNTNKQLEVIEQLERSEIYTKSSPSGKAKVLYVGRQTVDLEVLENRREAYDDRYHGDVYTLPIDQLYIELYGDGSKPARVWDRFTKKMKHWKN